ncbi:hypothetical protein QVD99_003327 [Batrachochytrium dendrobatidis]|nr:hypothetical protein QVD99_003327 [Batrachochytrium dendrobatidis]
MLFEMTNSLTMSRLFWILIYRLIRLVKTWSVLNYTLRVLLPDVCFFATKDVIQQTYGLVTFVNDIFPYVKGTIGDQSNNVVDRLFSSSLVENDVWNIQTDTLKR